MLGCYPGSFDPPTVAHLAIAEAAVAHAGLTRLDLVLSEVTLGKAAAGQTPVADRVRVLQAVASTRPWLGVRMTAGGLLVDIAAGYDVLVCGADKWAQVCDPAWYGGDRASRDGALARLPRTLVADRAGAAACHPPAESLAVAVDHLAVSSSAVRAGRRDWLLAEAAASGLWPAAPPA